MSTETGSINLLCPYCGHEFAVDSDQRCEGRTPFEVACVPYTRTRGERQEGADAWSRIGLDFFAQYANWEAIGILRVPSEDTALDVSYQLAECDQCHRLFDAYLNWTPDRQFATLWPHLFGRDARGEIVRYQGRSLSLGVVEAVAKPLGSLAAAVVALPLLLYVLSFVPAFLIAAQQAPDAPWAAFWEESAIQILTRAVGAIALSGLLWQLASYRRFVTSDRRYYDLFDVQQPGHTTHWLNYTLARLVGVQKPGGYAIDQVTVLAGIPAALILVSVWMLAQLSLILTGGWFVAHLVLLLIMLVVGYLLGGRRRLRASDAPLTLRGLIFPINAAALKGMFLAGTLWGAIAIAELILNAPGDWPLVVDSVFEVAFWAVVAYFVGIAVQFAFTTNLYIYFQISRIPLRLHPLRRFQNMSPVYTMINATTRALLITLFMLLGLLLLEFIPWQALGLSLTPSTVLGSTSWLFDWVNVGFVLMFAVLGIAVSPLFPVGVLVYFVLLLGGIPALFAGFPACSALAVAGTAGTCLELRQGLQVLQIPVGTASIPFMPSLVLQGAFVSLIVYFHMQRGTSLTQSLRQKAKDDLLTEYEQQIVKLNRWITPGGKSDPDLAGEFGDKSDSDVIDELQKWVELRDYVLGIKVSEGGFFRRVVDVASPLLFSIVLPTLVQFGIEQVIP